MTAIAEAEGMLGEEQFGFRQGRSTIDALFILTTLFSKARAKTWPFQVAFIDIKKVSSLFHPLCYTFWNITNLHQEEHYSKPTRDYYSYGENGPRKSYLYWSTLKAQVVILSNIIINIGIWLSVARGFILQVREPRLWWENTQDNQVDVLQWQSPISC